MLRLVLLSLAFHCASAIVCSPDACMTVRCAAVTAESCAGGKIVQNGGYCGCCDSCVMTLAEGDHCMSSLLLGVPASSQCAEGLVCDYTTATCQYVLMSKRQVASVMTCAERVQQMQTATGNGLPLLGQFIPDCETDGSYSAKQCQGSQCYCVDNAGDQITGYSANIWEAANMDCQCARDKQTYMQSGLIGKLFSCTDTGSYQRYQCTGSVCFCADNQGNMLASSPTVNVGDIGTLQCP